MTNDLAPRRRWWSSPGGENPEAERGWWLVRMLATALIAVTLAFAPRGSVDGVTWAVFAAATACWLTFAGLDRSNPSLASYALAASSILPAFVVGHETQGTAVILVGITLLVLSSHLVPSVRLIFTVAAVDVALTTLGCVLEHRSATTTLSYVAVLVLITLMGLNRRQYRVQARQSKLLLDQVRETQREQARSAALDERARLAREMHDVLAHSLGGLSVQLEVAEALLHDKRDIDAALERVSRSRRLAREGLLEARDAVTALRADVPPLPDALANLVGNHRFTHEAVVAVDTEGPPRPVATDASVVLLRLTREALTNAARHAPGEPVTLLLAYDDDSIRLTVTNPLTEPAAPPGTAEPGSGYGISGMRERLALVGGTLSAGRRQAGGGVEWKLIAEVPG